MMEEDGLSHGKSSSSSGPLMPRTKDNQDFTAMQPQLLCAAIHFFHRHIRSDSDVLQRMEGNQMFRLFFEVPYHNKPDLNRIFQDSVHDCSALHVCSFILSILHQGIFSVSAFIVSVIYLSRFKESSRITLHACTWRPLFLTSLLLADKMWEDKPVRNSSLAKLFPVLNNSELNRMESEFLDEIKFNVLVKPDLFCNFCEKLLAEQVHLEISRCVSQSEYSATLEAECAESLAVAKPLNGKPLPEELLLTNGNGSSKMSFGSVGGTRRPKSPEVAQPVQQHPHRPEATSVSRHSMPCSRPQGQVPVAWMDASIPSASGSVVAASASSSVGAPGDAASTSGSTAPRSQSAGPCASCGSRRVDGQVAVGNVQLHPALAQLRAAGGLAPAAQGPLAHGSQQPGRSVSVHHPLHRNDSTNLHAPSSQAEEVPDHSTSRAGHPSVVQTSAVTAQQLLRRSLPAKTSNGYVPLPRAPCAGSAVSSGAEALSVAGTGSMSQSNGPPSQRSSHPQCGSSCLAAVVASGGTNGLQSRPVQSPRSPVGMTQTHMLLASKGHPVPVRATVGAPGQVQVPSRVSQLQGSSHRASTPPALSMHHGVAAGQAATVAAQMAKAHQSRGSSPAGGPLQQHVSVLQHQPARASSAPRVVGVAGHNAHAASSTSNVRACSQPMQAPATHLLRQAPPNVYRAGSPAGVTSHMVSGGAPAHPYAHHQQMVYAGNPVVRGVSPAGGIAVAGGVQMQVNRGTLGHRNPSPAGLAVPNSPAGYGMPVQIPISSSSVPTTRGRSPPPSMTPMGAYDGTTARAPRAVTPNSLVKGIPQGVHVGGLVQRTSLRAGQQIHRPGLM